MKSLKNLAIGLLTAGILFGNSLFGQGLEKKVNLENKKSKDTKFAVVFVGNECKMKNKTAYHPIDENASLLNGIKIYNSLRKFGVSYESIYFLYPRWNEDFSDTLVSPISGEVKKKFNYGYYKSDKDSGYYNLATKDNFKRYLKEIADNYLDSEDTLIISIQGHGSELGEIYCDVGSSKIILPDDINSILSRKSKNLLVVASTCYSKNFLDKINVPGNFIGSSTDRPSWADRQMDFSEIYFKSLIDKKNDLNKDGKVDFNEAFEIAQKEYKCEGQKKMNFMNGEYLLFIKNTAQKNMLLNSIRQINWDCYYKTNKANWEIAK